MSDLQLLVAHAVKVSILVALIGMVARRRHERSWAMVVYLFVALVGNSLTSFWPETFYNYDYWTRRQAFFDLLKLAIALELAHQVFRAFPGARSRWRLALFAILAMTTVGVASISDHAPYRTWFELQARIIVGTVWLFVATALIVVWHRLPLDGWHYAILMGFTPYLLVFTTGLAIVRQHGVHLMAWVGLADSVAYLALVTWWAAAAWRSAEARFRVPSPVQRQVEASA